MIDRLQEMLWRAILIGLMLVVAVATVTAIVGMIEIMRRIIG